MNDNYNEYMWDLAIEHSYIIKDAKEYRRCGKFKISFYPFNDGNGKSIFQRASHHELSCKVNSNNTQNEYVDIVMTKGGKCCYPYVDKNTKDNCKDLTDELRFVYINYEVITILSYDIGIKHKTFSKSDYNELFNTTKKSRNADLPKSPRDILLKHDPHNSDWIIDNVRFNEEN